MSPTRKTKQIAPRLKDAVCRERFFGALPDAVKEGIRDIAHAENKSMSWVVEYAIVDYFGLRRLARYKTVKPVKDSNGHKK